MGLSVALRIWNIWKCKGLDFAQFWSNIHQSSSNWSYTTQIFNEKYRHLIFVKNLGDMGKKREGGVCQGWNFWEWQMRSLAEKNLKIVFWQSPPSLWNLDLKNKPMRRRPGEFLTNESTGFQIVLSEIMISKKWEQLKLFCKIFLMQLFNEDSPIVHWCNCNEPSFMSRKECQEEWLWA